jgi:hypothetical protein
MLAQDTARTWPAPVPAEGAVLPFDYGATFEIAGEPGRVVSNVIATSGDSTFVAVGLAYGFEEECGRPLGAFGRDTEAFGDERPLLCDVPTDAWIDGVRLDAQFSPVALAAASDPSASAFGVARQRQAGRTPFERVRPPSDPAFLFSLVDTATGRELQDEPTLNVAALGAADGRRPLRTLARPVAFGPRTTLRLQIVERTPDVIGTIHVVLVGYKAFEASRCVAPRPAATTARSPGARVIPFDFVVSLDLAGIPGRIVEDEVPVVAEAGAAVTGIGYGLDAGSDRVPIGGTGQSVDLRNLPMRRLGMDTLLDGVRLRPALIPFAIDGDGGLATSLPRGLADQVFERVNRPERVGFRYELHDTATGRELQNQPLFNVAGLGRADGQRPFKRLARPLELEPRSVLRVTVREGFGRGRLYVAFHGFKVIGAAGGWA